MGRLIKLRRLFQTVMSALPPKADMCTAVAKVRFGPIVDSRVTANCARICGIDKLVLIESARSAAA